MFVILLVLVSWQDQYSVLQRTVSPNGKRVAALIGNHGGGGPGYCRDLVYNFPNSPELPSITSNWAEWRNDKYLVEVVFCGDIKKLEWKNQEIIWEGKSTALGY